MALPRILSLNSNNDLQMTFAPQTQSLRAKSFALPQTHADVRATNIELPRITLENLCAELASKISFPIASLQLIDRHCVWYSISYTQENSKATITVNLVSYQIPISPASRRTHHQSTPRHYHSHLPPARRPPPHQRQRPNQIHILPSLASAPQLSRPPHHLNRAAGLLRGGAASFVLFKGCGL
jgi:hypothetical protein